MIKEQAGKYSVPFLVEKDFLVTRLFPADVAEGGIVIFFAYSQEYLDQYKQLKQERAEAVRSDKLSEIENNLAWRFGKLLCYTDEKIESLLAENR